LKHLEERVDAWSYMKTLYLKNVGWHGLCDGKESGMYRVGPLARLNAAEGMATPLAQQEYEKMFDVYGGKPVHIRWLYHWARLIEVLFAAERMNEIACDGNLTDPEYQKHSPQISA
jgi:F420-non-reducing hydrogenase large subunit